MTGALRDLLVLDLSRLLPGPYCSMILADHGARVIAVEDRRYAEARLGGSATLHRNKQHMCLNLKTREGKAAFQALAGRADVVLEGFRPGVVDRLGVGYKDVRRINPRIVYCSISGFGQSGPLRGMAGHDVNYLAESGALSLNGPAGGPPVIPGIQVGDLVGGLNAVVGILLALAARERTGKGQYVDISMTDGLTALLPLAAEWMWRSGAPPRRGDWLLSQRFACYNVYRTADAGYVSVGALEPHFWEALCRFFGVPDYVPLQFDEERREEIIGFFAEAFASRSRDEWEEALAGVDACVRVVLELPEALERPHCRSREMVVPLDTGRGGTRVLGVPVKLSETPGSVRKAPPEFGGDTEEILRELGYSTEDIDRMRSGGAI